MPVLKTIRRAIKDRIFGETVLPEEFATCIPDPQQEISVMLEGTGAPIDVTFRHSTACAAPFLLAVAFDKGQSPNVQELRRLSLKFYERSAKRHLLGEIGLHWKETVPVSWGEVLLFAPASVRNHCLPRVTLCTHHLLHLLHQWQTRSASAMKMSFLERRAAMVSFVRPHPTVLVSTADELGGNIFPMNIMGALGPNRFGFTLRQDRLAGQLVERVKRVVISNVPSGHGSSVYGLARNHTKAFVDWDDLPFATMPSPLFRIPIPEFALRVREMELEQVHRIGSHSFFVARILGDTVFSPEPSLCVIHGYYQTWRIGGRSAEMKTALLEDSFNRHGESVHENRYQQSTSH
jgi:flavin reductase (DIM6/NTAB) family NADH-FMN oxidoreductase RutF